MTPPADRYGEQPDRLDPASYPWRPVPETCLVTADRVWSMRAHRTDDWPLRFERRRPILAIGSNRSAATLRRKFATLDHWAVPVTQAEVTGLYVGYAACVSRLGWVPWAPMAVAGDAARGWILWLDDRELAVLDATEPNYRRLPLPARHQVWLESGRRLPGVELYRSRHGLIAGPNGTPVPAAGQTEALDLVQAALGRRLGHQDLADNAADREAVRMALAARAVDDGLNW